MKKIYTDYGKVLYMMGTINAILKTNTDDLTVETIKNILKGVMEDIENT